MTFDPRDFDSSGDFIAATMAAIAVGLIAHMIPTPFGF